MDINLPDVHAEVSAVFARYEHALVEQRRRRCSTSCSGTRRTPCATASARTWSASRRSAPSAPRARRSGLARTLRHTVITTFGRDFATAMTEFRRDGAPRAGRQSQTWVRTAAPGHGGWRVVAAHVSLLTARQTRPTDPTP